MAADIPGHDVLIRTLPKWNRVPADVSAVAPENMPQLMEHKIELAVGRLEEGIIGDNQAVAYRDAQPGLVVGEREDVAVDALAAVGVIQREVLLGAWVLREPTMGATDGILQRLAPLGRVRETAFAVWGKGVLEVDKDRLSKVQARAEDMGVQINRTTGRQKQDCKEENRLTHTSPRQRLHLRQPRQLHY